MNTGMILYGALLVCTALSFTLLHRARRIAVGLWSAEPSYPCLCDVSGARQPAEMNGISRS